jgi:hypothetical protein
MTEVDDLLRADAEQWRARLAPPPDLDTAARAAATGGRGQRGSNLTLALPAAASVLLIVAVALLVQHAGHRSPTPHAAPASIRADGHRVPYAGAVPWANPVSDPDNPRVFYVFADNDRIRADNVCDVTADKTVVVEQTSDSVTILIAGYATPLGSGQACAGVGHPPERQAVTLPQPLAGRTIIDASDGKTHIVLDPATVPAPHHIPSTCPATPLQWDEQTGVATRTYTTSPQLRCLILMQYGPAAALQGLQGPIGTVSDPIQVSGATAEVWRYDDVNNHAVTLQWSPTPGHEIRLTVNSPPAQPFTDAQILAIARSIN